RMCDGWLSPRGYRVVSVDPAAPGLKLSQRRFTYLEGAPAGQWRVPVLLRASVKKGIVEKRLLLGGGERTVPLPAAPDWVVVNAGGDGRYRGPYAPPPLQKLLGALGRLEPIDRFNLVSRCFSRAA